MTLLQRYIDDCLFLSIADVEPKTMLYDDRTVFDGSQDGSDFDGIYPRTAPGPNGTIIHMPCELEETVPLGARVDYLDYSLIIDYKSGRIHTTVYD